MNVKEIVAISVVFLSVLTIVVLVANGTLVPYGQGGLGELQGIMNQMMEGGDDGQTMSEMMSQAPKDVTIEFLSNPEVLTGNETKIELMVLGKETEKLITDAKVIVGIEKGYPMKTMEMVGGMVAADNIGNGKYSIKFTPDKPGVYTLHTHVVLQSKPMHSMMENHVDFGIVAE